MNNFPNVEQPQPSLPETHQQHLAMLFALKETRASRGCQTSLESYLNWLFGKVLTYEKDTNAWDHVTRGGTVRTHEEYIQQSGQRLHQIEQQSNYNLQQAQQELNAIQREIAIAKQRLYNVNEQADLADVGFHEYSNPAEESVRLKEKLDNVKSDIKEMVKDKTAIKSASGFTFNNSAKEGQKFLKDFRDLMLNAYNQEVENTLVKLEKTRGLQTAISRIEKASDKVEKLGSMMSMSVHPRYHRLRLKEVQIAFEYKEAEAQRKAEEKEEREKLKEEEKARKDAERKIREAEQEERKKRAELEELLSYQQQHYANVSDALPQEDPRIAELQAQIAGLEAEKGRAQSALLNTKAGYVYIISNIGSFGEGVVKIGLTRRQNPDDRVKELSDASVPFIFDTHAIHFSQNAVDLERKLHQHFSEYRVNRVNNRKEFFRVSLDDVKKALVQFSGDGATLRFNDVPEASDYRISIGETQ